MSLAELLWYEEEYKGYTIKVYQDEGAENPRTAWSNACHFIFFHSDGYGDKHEWDMKDYATPLDFWKAFYKANGPCFIFPVRAYEHGNIAFSFSTQWPFDCRWDSYWIGFIYLTYEEAWQEWGNTFLKEQYGEVLPSHVTKSIFKRAHLLKTSAFYEKIANMAAGELEVYNAYCNGVIAGYIATDDEGNHIDSCWGYYGDDTDKDGYMMQEARSAIDNALNNASYAAAI